jgi:hypothetical protein
MNTTGSDLNIISPFVNLSRVPFRLDDAEDARHGYMFLNNRVDIRVRRDAAARYLDEESHLLRRNGTLNVGSIVPKRFVSTEDARAFRMYNTGAKMCSL